MTTETNVYTASDCMGNPGPGGYAAMIQQPNRVQHLAGRDTHTDPERLQLLAAAEALKAIPPHAVVTIHTESPQLADAMRRVQKGEVRTPDNELWGDIRTHSGTKTIRWEHTPPNKSPEMRSCRRTAKQQARKAKEDLREIKNHQG